LASNAIINLIPSRKRKKTMLNDLMRNWLKLAQVHCRWRLTSLSTNSTKTKTLGV